MDGEWFDFGMKMKISIFFAGIVLLFIIGCSRKSSKNGFDHGEHTIEKMSEPPPQYRSTDSFRRY